MTRPPVTPKRDQAASVARASAGCYATSAKNITGCALAIACAALALAGVFALAVGVALMLPLYVVGAMAAPRRRHGVVVGGVDARKLQRTLQDVQDRALPPVPREVRFKVKRITRTMTELLPRADALGPGSRDQYVLVQCATDYLPTAFQAYLDLPRDYADHHVMADGKTPVALLCEQLDLLTKQVDAIADRVNGAHTDKLIASGRFLDQKFGRGQLDLDAGAAVQ